MLKLIQDFLVSSPLWNTCTSQRDISGPKKGYINIMLFGHSGTRSSIKKAMAIAQLVVMDQPLPMSKLANHPMPMPKESCALVPWFLGLYQNHKSLPVRYKISHGYLKDVMTTIPPSYMQAACMAYSVSVPKGNKHHHHHPPPPPPSSNHYTAPVAIAHPKSYIKLQQQPHISSYKHQSKPNTIMTSTGFIHRQQQLMIKGVTVYPPSTLAFQFTPNQNQQGQQQQQQQDQMLLTSFNTTLLDQCKLDAEFITQLAWMCNINRMDISLPMQPTGGAENATCHMTIPIEPKTVSSYLCAVLSTDPKQWHQEWWVSDKNKGDLSWEIIMGLGCCDSHLCLAPVLHQPGQPAVWEARQPLLGQASQVGSINSLYKHIIPNVNHQCQDTKTVVQSLLTKAGCLNTTTVQLHTQWIDIIKAQQNCNEPGIMLFNHNGELMVNAMDQDDGRRLCMDTIFSEIYNDDDNDDKVVGVNTEGGEPFFFHQMANPNCSFKRLAKYCATQGISLCLDSSWSQTQRRHTTVEAILRFNSELIEMCKSINHMCRMDAKGDNTATALLVNSNLQVALCS
jgi:hypothetical protein